MKFSNAPVTSTADLLRRVRKLLAVESRWTKGTYGRDANGEPSIALREAVCWCLEGAISVVRPGDSTLYAGDTPYFNDAVITLHAVVPARFDRDIFEFNDDPDTTHADVLAAIDRAIAIAKMRAI